ncbi:hypothetical protein LR013_01820 [candidate division NPL-UPA2 bacterium]|nr:hypothetical protein [candidate division NPL-UPA2 bacterium]
MLRQYVKGKFTMWLLVVSLALLSGCAGCPGGNDARQMFFDRQTGVIAEDFFAPVGLNVLKTEEENRRLEREIEEWKKANEEWKKARREGRLLAVPPIPPFTTRHSPLLLAGQVSILEESEKTEKMLNFLVNQGYLRVVTLGRRRYNLYTDKIKKHLRTMKVRCAWAGVRTRTIIKLGKRVLRSIDYSHQFEEWGQPHWAITFSYVIKPTLPGLPRVNRVFEGRAVAAHDPRTGQWVLQEVRLPSERPSEISEIIRLLPSP